MPVLTRHLSRLYWFLSITQPDTLWLFSSAPQVLTRWFLHSEQLYLWELIKLQAPLLLLEEPATELWMWFLALRQMQLSYMWSVDVTDHSVTVIQMTQCLSLITDCSDFYVCYANCEQQGAMSLHTSCVQTVQSPPGGCVCVCKVFCHWSVWPADSMFV